MNGYTTGIKHELSHYGVRVVCLEPGFTETPLTEVFKYRKDVSQSKLQGAMQTYKDSRLFKRLTTSKFMDPQQVGERAMYPRNKMCETSYYNFTLKHFPLENVST